MQQDSEWLVITGSHVFSCCVKRRTSESVAMCVRKEGKTGVFPPLNLAEKLKIFRKSEDSSSISIISIILAVAVYLPVWHTAQELGSLFWCHAVVSLQFTHVLLLRLQMQRHVAKLVSGLFDRYSLLRSNNMAFQFHFIHESNKLKNLIHIKTNRIIFGA